MLQKFLARFSLVAESLGRCNIYGSSLKPRQPIVWYGIETTCGCAFIPTWTYCHISRLVRHTGQDLSFRHVMLTHSTCFHEFLSLSATGCQQDGLMVSIGQIPSCKGSCKANWCLGVAVGEWLSRTSLDRETRFDSKRCER